MNFMARETTLILDNIRSVHNVGSIFRTADAAGAGKIFLCGTTPTPVDRFGRARNDFAKTALGAQKLVKWEYFKDTADAVRLLKDEGFQIISVEQASGSIDYKNLEEGSDLKRAFVFGSETEGVSEEVLRFSDMTVEIPMKGEKESLNVSVTVGIILFSSI